MARAFNNWNTTASPLTNTTANPTIYRGTFKDLTDAPGNVAQYKFVINGGTWESINNRGFTLTPPSQTLPVAFFNEVNGLGKLSISGVSGGQVTLTWTAYPAVRLQSSTDLKTWKDVANTLGADTAMAPITSPRQFFRSVAP